MLMLSKTENGHSTAIASMIRSLGSILVVITLWVMIVALAGCSGEPLSTREEGTLGGGAIGAGTGAIIGSAVGAPGAGAAIGGALGAGTGMLVGNEMQNNEDAEKKTQAQISSQQSQIEQQRQQIQQLQQSQNTE
jgi:osmotically inducible lipoprotein OsmB